MFWKNLGSVERTKRFAECGLTFPSAELDVINQAHQKTYSFNTQQKWPSSAGVNSTLEQLLLDSGRASDPTD